MLVVLSEPQNDSSKRSLRLEERLFWILNNAKIGLSSQFCSLTPPTEILSWLLHMYICSSKFNRMWKIMRKQLIIVCITTFWCSPCRTNETSNKKSDSLTIDLHDGSNLAQNIVCRVRERVRHVWCELQQLIVNRHTKRHFNRFN